MNVFLFILAFPMAILAANNTAGIYASTPSAIIPWSAQVPKGVDQGQIYNNVYYLADQTNAGVRVVNLTSRTETTIVNGSFVGLSFVNGTVDHDTSGPDGLVILPDRNELYAGNGDGTVKVIDIKTNTLVYSYPPLSRTRADEGAYDQANGIVAMSSPAETPPYLNFLSAANRTLLGQVKFPNATGLDQPLFNPADGLFYVSVTSIPDTNASGGEIAVIDAKSLKIVNAFPVHQCMPSGIVFGPSNHLFVACSGQASLYGYEASYVMDVTTGTIIANISDVSGIDQVAYSSLANVYFGAANSNSVKGITTPQLQIISAEFHTLVQTFVTDTVLAHSVAVDSTNGNVVVPIQAKGVVVYSLGNSNSSTTSPSSTPSPMSTAPISTSAAGKLEPSVLSPTGLGLFLACLLVATSL